MIQEAIIVQELNNALIENNVDIFKFWSLDYHDKKFYVLKWIKCYDPIVFPTQKSLKIRNEEVAQRKKQFFEWIKKTKNYNKIKRDD